MDTECLFKSDIWSNRLRLKSTSWPVGPTSVVDKLALRRRCRLTSRVYDVDRVNQTENAFRRQK